MKNYMFKVGKSIVYVGATGDVLKKLQEAAASEGYAVKTFDTINFKESKRYNPLSYVHDSADAECLADILIQATDAWANDPGESFVSTEKLLLRACIEYLIGHPDDLQEPNLKALEDMMIGKGDDGTDSPSHLDNLFSAIPQDSSAARLYQSFKMAAGRTQQSVMTSCWFRFARLSAAFMGELTKCDELELDKLSKEKTALFISTFDTDVDKVIVRLLVEQIAALNGIDEPIPARPFNH